MMGHRECIWAIAGLALVSGVFACVGGAGGPSDGMAVWEPTTQTGDRAASSWERVFSTLEGAPRREDPTNRSAESAPGAQSGAAGGGGAGLLCPATYECRAPNGEVGTVTLSRRDGQCALDRAIFQPDGKVTVDGWQVGAWVSTRSAIVVTATFGTMICTLKSSAGVGGSGGMGSSSSSGSGSSGGGDDPPPPPPPQTDTEERAEPGGGAPPGGG
jgi:hypothetical protein